MSKKTNKDANILLPAAEKPISDYDIVMAKIKSDSHKNYKGPANTDSNQIHKKTPTS